MPGDSILIFFKLHYALIILLGLSSCIILARLEFKRFSLCKHGLLRDMDIIKIFFSYPGLNGTKRLRVFSSFRDAFDQPLQHSGKLISLKHILSKDKISFDRWIRTLGAFNGTMIHVTKYDYDEEDEITESKEFPELSDVTDAKGRLFVNGQELTIRDGYCETEISEDFVAVIFTCESKAIPCVIQMSSSLNNETIQGENSVYYKPQTLPETLLLEVKYAACRLDRNVNHFSCSIKVKRNCCTKFAPKLKDVSDVDFDSLKTRTSDSVCKYGVLNEIDIIHFTCIFPCCQPSICKDTMHFTIISKEQYTIKQWQLVIPEECVPDKDGCYLNGENIAFSTKILAITDYNDAFLLCSSKETEGIQWYHFPKIYDIKDAEGKLFINGKQILFNKQCETEVSSQFLSMIFLCESKATPCLIEISTSNTKEIFNNMAVFNASFTDSSELILTIKFAACRLDKEFHQISCNIKVNIDNTILSVTNWLFIVILVSAILFGGTLTVLSIKCGLFSGLRRILHCVKRRLNLNQEGTYQ